METTYMPIKTGFRNKTLRMPVDNFTADQSKVKSRRFCIGGRGREWGPECFRVLELMIKREDTDIFMQPVDAVQHPEYYSMVKDPIDLSKIQLKFHSGMYQSMFTFVDDVHLMFSNYLLLYDEPSQPVHESIKDLKIWFDEEMDKIRKKWFFYGSEGSTSSKIVTKQACLPKEMGDRIDAIEAENKILVGPRIMATKLTLDSTRNNLKVKPRAIIKDAPQGLQPLPNNCTMKNSQLVLKKLPLTKPVEGGDGKPMYAFQISKAPPTRKIIISKPPTTGTPSQNTLIRPKPIIVIPTVSTATKENILSSNRIVPGDCITVISQRSDAISTNRELSDSMKIDDLTIDKDSLVINNSNMWLGVTQVTSTRPVVVNDDGVLINFKIALSPLKKNRGGPIRLKPEEPLTFLIRPDDLVKCYAYVANSQKHTIFLMVLPNCIRRLRLLVEERLRKVEEAAGLLDSFVDSCLITIFTPALTKVEVSQLMYFMWSLGKSSMFSCNLYTEINQKASLKLLGNVKPTLSNLSDLSTTTKSSSTIDRLMSESKEGSYMDLMDVTDGNKTDDQSCVVQSPITEEISSDNIELEEIPLDDIQLKEEPIDEGPEIINLDEAREITLVDNDDQTATSKPRHKPGILSRRACKRTALVMEPIPPKKGKIEEKIEDRKLSANIGQCRFTSDGVLIHGLEGPEIIDMDEDYKDGLNKDFEIIHPDEDSDSNGSELEIKYLDQTEEGELIWTGRKISIRCPITQKIMKEPVRNEICGHTYDKIGVEELVKNRGTRAKCPVPGCRNAKPLELSHLELDETVKQILQNK